MILPFYLILILANLFSIKFYEFQNCNELEAFIWPD